MALYFPADGSGAISLADNPAQAGRSAWTWAGWFRHDARLAAGRVFWFTGSGRIFGFSYAPAGPAYRASIAMGGSQKSLDIASAAAITTGQWYHAAARCSGGVVEGYLNGQSVGTVAVTGTTDNQTTFTIGSAGGGSDGWNGALYEWAEWNADLGAAVIAALASGQLSPREIAPEARLWALWCDALTTQPEVDDAGWNALASPSLGGPAPAPNPALRAARPPRLITYRTMGAGAGGGAPQSLAAPAASSAWTVPTPTLTLGTLSLAAAVATATWTAATPTLTRGGLSLAAPAASGTWAAPLAAISTATLLQPPAASSSWAAATPALTVGGVSLGAPVAASTWHVAAPAIAAGAVSLAAPAAHGAWTAPLAAITTVAPPPAVAYRLTDRGAARWLLTDRGGARFTFTDRSST